MRKTIRRAGIVRTFANVTKGAVLAAPLFFAGPALAMQQDPQIPDYLEKTSFADLAGWKNDNHESVLSSFLRFCEKPEAFKTSHALPSAPAVLSAICKSAENTGPSAKDAREFFEEHFTPYRVKTKGFVTGYFEPEVAASRTKTAKFTVPLHRKPPGLEAVTEENRPEDWPDHLSHGRREGNTLSELPDRGAIMDGHLDDESLELVWLEDPIDAYFIHVQGSARLRLTDGSVMRVGYAGKTGHPYTGIGRLLVKRGEGSAEDFTMSGLRGWLTGNPDKRDPLFRENRSYIFFREVPEISAGEGPVGAAGLPLSPGRSLAIDPAYYPYGALLYVQSDFQDETRSGRTFARLMVADDTGSAIKGAARGDIFVGSGSRAGQVAGDIRHSASFTLLLPNSHPDDSGEATD